MASNDTWLQDKLTSGKLRADLQLFECDRIFAFELLFIKVLD
jgi:hypothetical protein